ncbi:hypothetical protein [Flavobacterium seoulense]|uniref:NERD domain-containing protein n=1 Tax=Flavobacterium seoulense TaxID=1492738 RepID=A0A066WT59_9FLAO|nr:hypothetical protein [Flavobacterium seoulense]KDN53830.1 hypothetical protein FEM21_29960 [Flavobacterium seoulense]
MKIAERIYKELMHEPASIWFINDDFGAKIMVKIPSPIIKSIMKGCKIEFLFGKDNSQQAAIFHTGLRVYDDPINYATITGTERFFDEHCSLAAIMNRSFTYIHFHNELGICVATAKLSFSIADQFRVLNLQGNPERLYCGKFDEIISRSLDCFDYSIKIKNKQKNVYVIENIAIEGKLEDWIIMNNTVIGYNEINHVMVDDKDEGSILEKEVTIILDDLFRQKLYLNPQITKAKGYRELTDVFAISDNGLFLIESKALGVIDSVSNKTMEKKVKGVQKQISTGIDQLVGASRKIESNTKIYDKHLKEIIFNKTSFLHCIVLVSELLPFGDWKTIEYKMFKVMVENKIYLNVIDLREFMQYVGHARGSADRLNLMLIERVEAFVKNENIHMRLNVMKE